MFKGRRLGILENMPTYQNKFTRHTVAPYLNETCNIVQQKGDAVQRKGVTRRHLCLGISSSAACVLAAVLCAPLWGILLSFDEVGQPEAQTPSDDQ